MPPLTRGLLYCVIFGAVFSFSGVHGTRVSYPSPTHSRYRLEVGLELNGKMLLERYRYRVAALRGVREILRALRVGYQRRGVVGMVRMAGVEPVGERGRQLSGVSVDGRVACSSSAGEGASGGTGYVYPYERSELIEKYRDHDLIRRSYRAVLYRKFGLCIANPQVVRLIKAFPLHSPCSRDIERLYPDLSLTDLARMVVRHPSLPGNVEREAVVELAKALLGEDDDQYLAVLELMKQ